MKIDFFFHKLKVVVSKGEVVIIYNRHQGLIRSVVKVFGVENHAHCYRLIKRTSVASSQKTNTKERTRKQNALQLLDTVAYTRLVCDYDVATDMLCPYNSYLVK